LAPVQRKMQKKSATANVAVLLRASACRTCGTSGRRADASHPDANSSELLSGGSCPGRPALARSLRGGGCWRILGTFRHGRHRFRNGFGLNRLLFVLFCSPKCSQLCKCTQRRGAGQGFLREVGLGGGATRRLALRLCLLLR